MKKPLLSIGMIFKNEIRCLERCMKSIAPLRAAVPCELVMADTGSTDGSREIAEKYADILFDFAWVNDFSAARNAVMDRCSGKWFLTIDSDEWLDEGMEELLRFLRLKGRKADAGAVLLRDYFSYDPAEWDEYSDAMPVRLLRMDTGLRYEGAIHESWMLGERHHVTALRNVVVCHDGYACLKTDEGNEKRARNVGLLREALAKEPDSLFRLQQFIDVGRKEGDYIAMVRRAVSLVEEKQGNWQGRGPALYRSAVLVAHENGLPELETWIRRAQELFPGSFMTRLDVEYIAFSRAVEKKDREGYARSGERWLNALEDYRAGRGDQAGMLRGAVSTAKPGCEAFVRIFTAYAYLKEDQWDRAWELLESVNGTHLDGERAGILVSVLQNFHACADRDTEQLLLRFWEQINQPVPSAARAAQRREAFLENGAKAFSPLYLQKESEEARIRHAYTIFLPLAGKCEIGTAAVMMDTEDPQELEKLFGQIERWDALPSGALEHALLAGAAPRSLMLEEIDALAVGLTPDAALRLAEECPQGDIGKLVWSRAAALAAVQTCDWEQEERGLELARAFARMEGVFLPQYYRPELLCDENIQVLPPMHRFGWYCAQAFETLDGGDTAGYVRLLKKGLAANPRMKTMVEFLIEHTPQLQALKPSSELLALAERVRTILLAYPPDDPAIAALKASPVYQRVAYLLEVPELAGGLP